MKLMTGLTLYVVLPLALTWLRVTEGRRNGATVSQRLDCLGKDRRKSECQSLKNEVDCGSHYIHSSSEVIITSQWAINRKSKRTCKWKFQTEANAELRISCQLALRRDTRCRSNLLITDGNSRRNKLCSGERKIGLTSDTGLLKIVSKMDQVRRNSNNFICTVGAFPKQIQVNTPPPPIVDPSVSSKCRCGRTNRAGRIVGGSQVTPHQYPWQVAIMEEGNRRPFCGGSIIADSWILTAAHCLIGKRLENIRVVVGEHDWSTTLESSITKTLRAKHMTWHYNFFLRKPLDNDIGLIQLEEPLEFPEDNSIAPVCLPPPNRSFSNVDAVVVGWGTTENKLSGSSRVLLATEVKTMTNDVCQGMVTIKGPVSDNMICAGFLFGGENACHGDSGGPLLTKGDGCGGNCLIHIGIVSWGAFCNLGVLPTVYTRTNRYLDWIRMYTRGSTTCQVESK